MAKVMVSLPDDLLARLDDQARRRGTSRSGLLRELAELAARQLLESSATGTTTLAALDLTL
jgi:metal-responsive CopG/Arc/MetJ family transcriptional regulator